MIKALQHVELNTIVYYQSHIVMPKYLLCFMTVLKKQ
ncbi:hypothetical protein Prede_1646 [Prevotella dentalis DSM 3688]|uniref:Uncharacterized protein n=1 Tax=Prevotella dentalis (strain ATCC 49559 / DSM 3688 / JCM 13448 / NCTC 12043 / ES 2772) TaxID=908937 RepID=L0JBQ2_PREDD|nr:hypothetical protein Prede_1646 [Prevotella dentalis DSM 3688]